jgi:beta-glucanase (GH16 family)
MKRLFTLIFVLGSVLEGTAQSYQLVWSDEFNGTSLNTNIWNIEVNGNGGGNEELQYYCEKGVSVLDGNLVLTATREDYMGKAFTSGRINSKNKVYFKHGKIEASIKMPSTANGLWPAFWLLGNDFDQVGWPQCGEIDIVEMGNAEGINHNTQDRYFNGACHWGFYNNKGQYPNYGKPSTWDYSLQDGNYHLFTCIWNDEVVKMYVDQDRYPTREPYYEMGLTEYSGDWAVGKYFHKPFFIIFNLAVGGNFPAIKNTNGITALADGPRAMYVDWVRVYQRGDASEEFYETQTNAIETVESPEKCFKIIRDRQLLIHRDGRTYTVTGQEVK